MLSNWKKSACADRAQSTGRNHRANIGEEAGPRRAKRDWTPRPGLALPFISTWPFSQAACSVWDDIYPSPPWRRRRGACFARLNGGFPSLSPARLWKAHCSRPSEICYTRLEFRQIGLLHFNIRLWLCPPRGTQEYKTKSLSANTRRLLSRAYEKRKYVKDNASFPVMF